MRFTQFRAFLTGFSQWAGAPGKEAFENPIPDEHQTKRRDKIENFGTIAIGCVGRTTAKSGDVEQRNIIRFWEPCFEPLSPLTFEEMLDTLRSFQLLQCLLQAHPVGWDGLHALIYSTGLVQPFRPSVEIFAMRDGFQQRYGKRNTHDMLVPLKELNDQWPDLVTKWFNYQKKFDEVLNLYFAVLFGESLFIEAKFLFLAQALEGYHRIQSGRKDRKLKQRLAEITDVHAQTLSKFIPDIPKFCEDIAVGRDYFAHPGEERLARLAGHLGHLEYSCLASRIRAVLEICFLTDLGVTGRPIDNIARCQ